MIVEYPARLSGRGDKILCGRPTGERGHCDGLIANVQHNLAGRTWMTLPRGEKEIEPGLYGLSKRAAARVSSGREIVGRTPWEPGAKLLPIVSLEVVPPFRKLCPTCKVRVLVQSDVLDSP